MTPDPPGAFCVSAVTGSSSEFPPDWDAELAGTRQQPLEMIMEPEHTPAKSDHGLEQAIAEQKTTIRKVERRPMILMDNSLEPHHLAALPLP